MDIVVDSEWGCSRETADNDCSSRTCTHYELLAHWAN